MSRGFGFVTFASSEEASAAIDNMDGEGLHGRIIRVNYASDRSSGGFRSGYGGGGGGDGNDSGLPSYNSEGGAYSSNTGVDSYSTSDGYPKEDANPLNDMKDDDLEPDDYANKRS